jgi:hypothetical protein
MQRISSATNIERATTFFLPFSSGHFRGVTREKFTAFSFFLDAIDHAHSINNTQFPCTYYSKQFHIGISDIPRTATANIPVHSVLSLLASRVVAIGIVS